MIQIHEESDTFDLQSASPTGLKPAFLDGLLSTAPDQLVANVETTMRLVQINEFVFPMTINDTEYENSYVCSPYTAMIPYSLEELENIKSLAVRMSIRALAGCMSPMLKIHKINRVVSVNNSMLSTNLYPDWKGEQIKELTNTLIDEYPSHTIMFRSLNRETTPKLCDELTANGYHLVPSRLLYIIDPTDRSIVRKRNNRIDFRLLRDTPYSVVAHEEFGDDDDARIKWLYDQLYLEKYSYHNPQFTAELIRLFRTTNQLQFMGIRNTSGVLVGVIATLEMNGQFTTPIVGYDVGIPSTHGLYRLLTTLVIKKAFAEKTLFNMSSGVGKFKQHRGAKAHIEYSAIFTKHLSMARRGLWNTAGWLMKNVAAPMAQKYEL